MRLSIHSNAGPNGLSEREHQICTVKHKHGCCCLTTIASGINSRLVQYVGWHRCSSTVPPPVARRRGAAAETLCDGNAHLLQPPRTPFDATRHRSCGTYVVFRITFLVGDEIGATAVLRWSNSHGTLPIIASCSMELELHRQFVMSPEKKCAHEMNWRVVATERTANAILPNTSTADVLVVGCCADPEVAAGLTASANCKRVTTRVAQEQQPRRIWVDTTTTTVALLYMMLNTGKSTTSPYSQNCNNGNTTSC